MSEYLDLHEEVKLFCEKCGKLLTIFQFKGVIKWICPEHGTHWRLEEKEDA